MPNGINEISPDLRDWLLGKNLILSDTIMNSGLDGLATGLGLPGKLETLPNAVQQSSGVMGDSEYYRDLNLLYNPYKSDNGNQLIDISSTNNGTIGNLPLGTPPTEYTQSIASKFKDSKFSISADQAREEMLKNKYYDADEIYQVNINTTFVASESNGVYDFKTSLLNRGVDFLANAVGLGGVSQSLGTIYDNKDTQMGRVANTELLKHFGYNAAFNTSRNTLGKVNLNPLNMLGGGDILTKNFTITVPKGGMGVDYMSKIIGVKMPPRVATNRETTDADSIFTEENPVSNTRRFNAQIENIGNGQVDRLIFSLSKNKFFPTVENKKDETKGLDGELYILDDGQGGIIDLLNTPKQGEDENTPIESIFEKEHGRITSQIDNDLSDSFGEGLDKGVFVDGKILKHTWVDRVNNKISLDDFGAGNRFTNKKSLLHKTEALFNSGKMKTLTTGHGVKGELESEVQNSSYNGYISKGSGVLSKKVLLNTDSTDGLSVEDVFCRTWTTTDRYDKVSSLQKNSGFTSNSAGVNRRNVENSVLDDNGFVRIGPNIGDGDDVDSFTDTKIKRFMFSIENLAWGDSKSLAFLPDCEKGPGDPMTGTRGRIMWFPPYEMSFTDNSSLNWDDTSFIGRGEPLYTYNNTERAGTLQWKIIIDHPSYLNKIKDTEFNTNEIFASIASGCVDLSDIISDKLTTAEKDEFDVANARELPETVANDYPVPSDFKMYHPNDNVVIAFGYEDGSSSGLGEYIAQAGYVTQEERGDDYINKKYPDTTNYGLNGCLSGDCPKGQKIELDGTTYDGWSENTYLDDLAKYILEKAPATKIGISGYASKDGEDTSFEANVRLAEDRAKEVEFILKSVFEQYGDQDINSRFEFVRGEGTTGPPIAVYDTPNKKYKPGAQCLNYCIDSMDKKEARHTAITFRYDPTLDKALTDSEKPTKKVDNGEVSNDIKKRFFSECAYFEKLGPDTEVVFEKLSEKIKYFHPSFHSITPEGFNSRLNFLLQCTRQGPTLGRENTASNLAFGRAPVCILRIGDFYHTKIIIENLNFSYEPLVWDMNPEGVGVQPMICSVDMSFKFIGGSSLQGPINRLQNAVSFNYFANTEIYDARADYIKKTTGVDGDSDYELVNGVNPNNFDTPKSAIKNIDGLKTGINNNEVPEVDEEERANQNNIDNQEE